MSKAKTIQIIRDVININDKLSFIDWIDKDLKKPRPPDDSLYLQRGDTIRLIARQITLTEEYNLQGKNLEIYAGNFIALKDNAVILNNGEDGVEGATGREGATGGSPANPLARGGPGHPGGGGGSGTDGGNVKVVAEVITGLKIHARGGNGRKGGDGGPGGVGADTPVQDNVRPGFEVILNAGGRGGDAGPPGNGGNGGTVSVSTVKYANTPSIENWGGKGGDSSIGGHAGRYGGVKWILSRPPVLKKPELERLYEDVDIPRSQDQAPGNDGHPPPDTAYEVKPPLAYDSFWSSIASEDVAVEWAKYRHAVGDFFFRSYIPGSADRDKYVGMAVDEFKAAIRLNPNQAESQSRLQQIWSNRNPLNIPRDLDVRPDFNEYMREYDAVGTLTTIVKGIGDTLLLTSSQNDKLGEIFEGESTQSGIRISKASADLNISQKEESDLNKALAELQKIIDDVKQQIEKAYDEMKTKPLSFGAKLVKVYDVASAVVAVVTAVSSGGASLIALVPECITLVKSVYDDAEPLAQAILDGQQTDELAKVKSQFDQVKKDADNVMTGEQKVIDLINLIKTIKTTKTPDNSKLMGLVQKAAELSYQYLLKQQELERAGMTTKSLTNLLASEKELLTFYMIDVSKSTLDAKFLREAGNNVVQAALAKYDILLKFAFLAQRSIEVYLLQDQTQNVLYDIGHVHPDLEADHVIGSVSSVELVSAYNVSVSQGLLKPTSMYDDYKDYFEFPNSDISRNTIDDPKTLEMFRSDFSLTFDIDVARDLPLNRYHAKILTVGIAFVGATGEGDVVSCRLEHDRVYSERWSDGVMPKTLHARSDIVPGPVVPLQIAGFSLNSGLPLDVPQRSNLWGMGVGGTYTITIPESEVAEHHATFDRLEKIQVWFEYRFLE